MWAFVSRLMTPASDVPLSLHQFQEGFLPLIAGIIVAIVLSFTMRETGSAGEVTGGQLAALARAQ
jgi:hypothetical protein